MALVTIQRSPSPSVEQDLDVTDSSDDVTDGKSQMRKSLSQSYFTVRGAALILPHNEFTKKSVRKTHGGEIQRHLQAMLHLLRPEDTITIAVRLEDISNYQRYMALVSTKGRQDTEEAVILGIDCGNSQQASIGLVLPVWMGLQITLGGDGGFSLRTDEQCYLFKPVSVQAMWSAIQSLAKVQHIADDMKYIRDGLSHTWVGYYRSRVDRRDSARVSQWNVEGVEVFAPSSLSVKSNDDEGIKRIISQTLKDVMMTVDLDVATSMTLRKSVEEKMNLSLAEFKGYFDEEVMRILGQMDEPSEILDFLYLGSEWNASNLEELQEKGIDYILNVTKEIDNFFEGRFHYYNVRVSDEDTSDLLKHWDKTYKFISKARNQGSKVLVHCKMGVSRSASTVMAFLMKERRWSVEEATRFVKERRSCVNPNAGFMDQLHMYEGILTASNKRDIFRSKSDQNLLDESAKDDLEPGDMSFLGGDLFHMMSHSDWLSASGGVAHGEEWIGSLHQDELEDVDMLQVGPDLETESRSADSMEEVLADMPSPAPETASRECLSLSLPSASASLERSSCDTESTKESRTDEEAQSDKSCGLLDCQQTVGSPTSRIKPDSSWIRLDTVETEEENYTIFNNKCMLVENVPCSHSHGSIDLNVGTLDSSVIGIPVSTDPHEPAITEFHRAASSDPHEAAIVEPHMAATEPHMATTKTEPLRAGTQLQWAITDLYGAAMESDWEVTALHRPPMDTHGSLAPQSELLQLRENSNEVQLLSSTSTATASEPIAGLDRSNSHVSLTDESNAHAHFYIGQTSLCTAPTIPSAGIDSSSVLHGQKCSTSGSSTHSTEKTISHIPAEEHERMELTDSPFVAVTPKSVEQDPVHQHCSPVKLVECCEAVLKDANEVSELEVKDPGGSGDTGTSSPSRSDLGVQQYFFRENIPWKPGKVKKMQKDINKTGQVSQDLEAEESMVVDLCQVSPATFFDVSCESRLLGQVSAHPQATGLSHSHSCMELCTQEDENLAARSLYEREKIPLAPGIVLRTKQEIEGRQRGEGDQELLDSSHPVLRTSSLKHQRAVPHSRYTVNRRSSGPVLSMQEGKSLGDANLGFGEIQQAEFMELETSQADHVKDMVIPDNSELENKIKIEKMLQKTPSTVQSAEAPSMGLVASPIEHSEVNFQNTEVQNPSGDDAHSHHPVHPDTENPPRARRNIDSETLALIREIGSALLMNPTTVQSKADADESQACSNMVRYFVRKIEQQTKIASPSQKTVVAYQKPVSSGISEQRKTGARMGGATPGILSSVSPLTSPTRSRQLIDVLPASSPCSTDPLSHFNTQERTAQAFTDSPTFQNSGDPDIMSSTTSHSLVDPPSSLLETKHNVVLQVLSLSKTEPPISPRSEISPCSPKYSNIQHDSTEPSVVRHLVGKFEPQSPESDRSESLPDPSLRFIYNHGSKEDNSVAARSLEDSRNHSSVSVSHSPNTSSDNNLSSQPSSSSFLPVTTSSSSSSAPAHPSDLSFKHTSFVIAKNLDSAVKADNCLGTLSSNTDTSTGPETYSVGSAIGTSSVASDTHKLSKGSTIGSFSEAAVTDMQSVALATETQSIGSDTSVASAADATFLESAKDVLSVGYNADTKSLGSLTDIFSEGSVTDKPFTCTITDAQSGGSSTDIFSVGSATDTRLLDIFSEEFAIDTLSAGFATATSSMGYNTDTSLEGTQSIGSDQLSPTSILESSHEPGSLQSSCQVQFSSPSSLQEPSTVDALQTADSLYKEAELDVTMRQVSSEGRKIRRLHGKTHPLTKLADSRSGRGPFYNSM
ncbi:hypothetical protein BsWGS_08404 [Bradybaena similaris]